MQAGTPWPQLASELASYSYPPPHSWDVSFKFYIT